jgi:PPOX class probable F420-dependent enzyme
MAARLTDEQVKLFRDRNLGILATIREDGTPNVTPVWVDWDGEHIVFNTSYARAKHLHLLRDPRCTILVMNANDPYDWVSVTGTAIEITEQGAVEHLDSLARKYEGVETFPYLQPGERRVKIAVRPERILTYRPGYAELERAKARLRKRNLTY